MMCRDLIAKMPEQLRNRLENSDLIRPYVQTGFALETILTSKKILSEIASKLSYAEKKTLEAIIKRIGSRSFDWNLMEKCVSSSIASAEAKVGLIGLRQSGIIFTLRKAWGEQLFVLPSDALAAWQSVLLPAFVPEHAGEADMLYSLQGGLAEDLFRLLSYAAQNELSVTQKGTVHKRLLQALESILKLSGHEAFAGIPLSYAHSDTYDPGVAVVLDTAIRLEMLVLQDGAYRLNAPRTAAWFQLSHREQMEELVSLWFRLHFPAEVWLQHAAIAVREMPAGEAWASVRSLARWLIENGLVTDSAIGKEETLTERLLSGWLKPLSALGWVELGRDAAVGHDVFRRTDGLQETGEALCYVQPDYEVFVPPHVSPSDRWEFECIARYVKTDQIHIYRLTKESIHYACEQGRTVEDILKFLERSSFYDLPENVRLSVQQWGAQFGRLVFARLTLLRCKEIKLAEELERNPKCAPYLYGKIGELDFIVKAEQVQELMQVLQKAGYSPKRQMDIPGEPETPAFPCFLHAEAAEDQPFTVPAAVPSPVPAVPKGLFYSNDTSLFYEMDPNYPRVEELYPEMQHIPAMWLRDYRCYHASTRKEMIRKAIEWKSVLKLRKDGADRVIVPKRLQEERSSWSLIGMEQSREVRFSGDEWEEMKLILPGINDK